MQKAQNDKSGVDFFAAATPCNPLGRFVLTHSAQNDKTRRHCEQILQKFAWQSTNLNANLPLDYHEFARSRFANSRSDEVLVILRR